MKIHSPSFHCHTVTKTPVVIKVLIAAFLFMTVASLSGCAWFRGKDKLEKPAQELVQEGIKAYEEGDYRDAIKNFEQLKDWYPFSKYAILAELKIADAHYHLEEYPEAILAYESFEQLHPRNEAIPYVIYQIGRCHYNQIGTIDRDQTSAQKALETFQRLSRQYPDSEYTNQAAAHITQCLQHLSAHDFYVGLFYYRIKQYPAALARFQNVVTHYPDVGTHHQALQYIANCEALIKVQADEESKN